MAQSGQPHVAELVAQQTQVLRDDAQLFVRQLGGVAAGAQRARHADHVQIAEDVPETDHAEDRRQSLHVHGLAVHPARSERHGHRLLRAQLRRKGPIEGNSLYKDGRPRPGNDRGAGQVDHVSAGRGASPNDSSGGRRERVAGRQDRVAEGGGVLLDGSADRVRAFRGRHEMSRRFRSVPADLRPRSVLRRRLLLGTHPIDAQLILLLLLLF